MREVDAGSSAIIAVLRILALAGCWCILGDLHTTMRVCLLLKERGTSWFHLLTLRRATEPTSLGLPDASFKFLTRIILSYQFFFFHLFLWIEESCSADLSDSRQSVNLMDAVRTFCIFVPKDHRVSCFSSWNYFLLCVLYLQNPIQSQYSTSHSPGP